LSKPGDPGRNGIDNRMFMEAVVIPVHRHGHGTKGGARIKPSANEKGDGQPKFLP